MNNKKQTQPIILKAELIITPFLVIIPFIVSFIFIMEWYFNGFLQKNTIYNGELLIGIIIFFINILFAIPFLKGIIKQLQNYSSLTKT